MRLRETLNLPLSARDVPAMYADGDYTAIRRDVLRASSAESTVEGGSSGAFTVRTELALPTDRVPDIVRPFVGSSVTVREQQSWSAPEEDGSRRGELALEVAGTPASMKATLTLSPAGETSSTVEIAGDLVAKVPLLGARMEKAAVPYVAQVLRAEERAATTYRDSHSG